MPPLPPGSAATGLKCTLV